MYLLVILAIFLLLLGGYRALGTFVFWFSVPWLIMIAIALYGMATDGSVK